jgi:hypothetical protein
MLYLYVLKLANFCGVSRHFAFFAHIVQLSISVIFYFVTLCLSFFSPVVILFVLCSLAIMLSRDGFAFGRNFHVVFDKQNQQFSNTYFLKVNVRHSFWKLLYSVKHYQNRTIRRQKHATLHTGFIPYFR